MLIRTKEKLHKNPEVLSSSVGASYTVAMRWWLSSERRWSHDRSLAVWFNDSDAANEMALLKKKHPNMGGVRHPDERHYKAFARVCDAAEAPCEHPERAKGEEPFCGECLSCRAGAALLLLLRLANEHRRLGT